MHEEKYYQQSYKSLYFPKGKIGYLEISWIKLVQELTFVIVGPTLLVLHLSYYTLMTFLMMLFVILLSMLMILLSILSVIRHLICGKNLNWLLNLNLIYETLWAWNGLLISMLKKLNWFRLTGLITLVLLMWKWMALFLRKNHLLRSWHWRFLVNWIGALTLFLLLKLPPIKPK